MGVYLVNGTNRGIGLGLCQALVAQGHEVIATCRKSSPELNKLGIQVFEHVDLNQPTSFNTLADELGHKRLDVLINNAGMWKTSTLDDLNPQGIRELFNVNALGALMFVFALLPAMKKPSKMALITSRMGSIADNDIGGHYGYRMSKAALNMAGKSLSVDLAPDKIAVGLIHPGWVKTEMGGPKAQLAVEDSSRLMLTCIDALDMTNTGSFWHANGDLISW